jgi:hypothetical protein
MVLAATAGQELIKVMVTDGWASIRDRAALWFGRGDAQRAKQQAQQLDETRVAVQSGQLKQEAAASRWQGRLEALLDEHPELADDLHALVDDLRAVTATASVSSGDHGLAAGGNIDIRADAGSIAGGVIHGGASIGTPIQPDPSQG